MILPILVIASFVLALAFVAQYAMRRWWQYAPGRAVMLLAVGATMTLGLSTWRILIGPAPEWVRYLVFLLIPLAFGYLNVTVYRARKRADRREKESIR